MCVRGELWKSPHNVFLGGRWRGWTPKEGAPLWTSLIRFMSLNDRRGAEATSPLVARSVQAGQRPVFCKRDFSPKPPSSMTQRSRRKPLLQKDGFCRRGFRPEPPSSMRQGSRRKTLPYHHASRIDLAALVGPSVHAEPRRAADWYPNLRSLEEKIPLVIYKAGFCSSGREPKPRPPKPARKEAFRADFLSLLLDLSTRGRIVKSLRH
jgi:hypothetical protein